MDTSQSRQISDVWTAMQCPSLSVSELASLVTRIPVYTGTAPWAGGELALSASLAFADYYCLQELSSCLLPERKVMELGPRHFCSRICYQKETSPVQASIRASKACTVVRISQVSEPVNLPTGPYYRACFLEVRAKTCEMSAESFHTQTRSSCPPARPLTCKYVV